ncbi:MAG: hydroxymyristoyl-ACP dehydratase [Treponema sp.]|nr:hydroxymyristoyl-ACP dehydratase [Candidatus Treponema equi]
MKEHSIENEKIIEKGDSSVTLEFMVPGASDFFDGHFPQFKLLPAVGQFEIISRFSVKYFGVSRGVSSIKRMKFSAPVLPDTLVRLRLDHDGARSSVAFRMWHAADEARVFSSGTFVVASNE